MGYDRGDSFLSILNHMDFHLVQNRKENCHHDHIPFNMEGNGIRVFSVYRANSIWGWSIEQTFFYVLHDQYGYLIWKNHNDYQPDEMNGIK